jgi:predicted MFS family arabinose efflux permease
VIEAGSGGAGASPRALIALAIAAVAAVAFLVTQARGRDPMVPLSLFRSPVMTIAAATGFAFMAGFYGLVFIYSLYLQDTRGLSSFTTGVAFLPMTLLSGFVSIAAARLAERFGPQVPIIGGMALMGTGMLLLAALPASVPVWTLALLLIPIGISGPLAIPPTTALLLESVAAHRSGVASGVFNTSRQLGGALAVAVFGALLGHHAVSRLAASGPTSPSPVSRTLPSTIVSTPPTAPSTAASAGPMSTRWSPR